MELNGVAPPSPPPPTTRAYQAITRVLTLTGFFSCPVFQNFANTISARNDLERGLQVKQMDRANYETKLQQVGTPVLCAGASHACVCWSLSRSLRVVIAKVAWYDCSCSRAYACDAYVPMQQEGGGSVGVLLLIVPVVQRARLLQVSYCCEPGALVAPYAVFRHI